MPLAYALFEPGSWGWASGTNLSIKSYSILAPSPLALSRCTTLDQSARRLSFPDQSFLSWPLVVHPLHIGLSGSSTCARAPPTLALPLLDLSRLLGSPPPLQPPPPPASAESQSALKNRGRPPSALPAPFSPQSRFKPNQACLLRVVPLNSLLSFELGQHPDSDADSTVPLGRGQHHGQMARAFTSPSRPRPSVSTLLSKPPMSPTRSDTFTRSKMFTCSITPSDTFTRNGIPSPTPTPSPPATRTHRLGLTTTHTPSNTNTYTRTFMPTNTNTYSTTTGTHTPPASLRPPAQGSPRSPLPPSAICRPLEGVHADAGACCRSTLRPPLLLVLQRQGASKKPRATRSRRCAPKCSRWMMAGSLGCVCDTESAQARVGGSTPSAPSLRRGSAPSLRASGASSALPPSLNVAELSAYVQSNEAPLHIGLLVPQRARAATEP
ncbi:hypothetical protein B0H14DRAFT_3509820 [Mycena olivaceomarginata]|nr:hypothetical protein B0H14DRAFT_3509820 [Mycena olivaceomarginata]